jgi:hypothetical protein
MIRKPLISVRQEDNERIQKRLHDRDMQEIDEILKRADETLIKANSPARENNYSMRSNSKV